MLGNIILNDLLLNRFGNLSLLGVGGRPRTVSASFFFVDDLFGHAAESPLGVILEALVETLAPSGCFSQGVTVLLLITLLPLLLKLLLAIDDNLVLFSLALPCILNLGHLDAATADTGWALETTRRTTPV